MSGYAQAVCGLACTVAPDYTAGQPIPATSNLPKLSIVTSPTTAVDVPTPPAGQPDTEKRFVLIVSIIFALIMLLPYLWVWTAGPIGYIWGGLIGETFDPNVHLTWARQSRDGAFFVRDLFTTESFTNGEKPIFFNVLPWVWGKLALTGIPVIFWFHTTRIVAGVWTLWEFHKLSRRVLPQVSERKTALYLIAFTTGASFLSLLIPALGERFIFIDHVSPSHSFPFMPEAFLFTSAFLFPINVVSYGLMAFLFRKVVDSEESFRAIDGFAVLAGGMVLANIHTYDAIPVGLTLLFWMIFCLATKRKTAATACFLVLVGLAIPTLYQAVVFRNSEEFRIKALTPTTAPRFRHIAISLSPLLIFVIPGIIYLRKNRYAWLMAGWAVVTLICIYAPVSFARKMIEGAQMPLALIAAGGLLFLAARIPSTSFRRLAPALFLGLLSLSPAYIVFWDLQNAAENNVSRYGVLMPPQYLRQSEWDALRFLDKQPDKNVAVMSLTYIGAYGPRETGMTYYLSHWAETLHFADKIKNVLQFYKARLAPADAANFLRKNRIEYVIETPNERMLAENSGFAQNYGLVEIWAAGESDTPMGDMRTVVYKVPKSQ